MKSKETFKIKIFRFSIIFTIVFICAVSGTVTFRYIRLISSVPQKISDEQNESLQKILKTKYSKNYEILKELPYKTKKAELNVQCGSAILINLKNGNILYEKNADEIIPPASMTKLFVMYEVFKEIENKNLSLTDKIDLPPECWACNMMPHSSLMFLGENQNVTLDELLTGLAVCSGNDASYAIAYKISGGMEDFIKRINETISNLGLKNTHIEEASGYSEKNITTAREMAEFSRIYLSKYAKIASKYHTTKSFTYPKEHNLAPEDIGKTRNQDFTQGFPSHITMPITQKNTNPLLGKLEGCNGLKTGYIEESGYNLCLSAEREGGYFLSVTMKGQGNNTYEGQMGRIHDGNEIMEWAFSTFKDYKNKEVLKKYPVYLLQAKEMCIYLVPAFYEEYLSVPKVLYNIENNGNQNNKVEVSIDIPPYITKNIEKGTEYGKLTYKLNGYILQEIPLVAEKSVKKCNFWFSFCDNFLKVCLK